MKADLPLISVVVPVYNIRDYVRKCLESIIRQSYKNLEIIVVDDGSMDGSGEVCDKFAKIDSRVRVVHQENGGLSSARNAGLKKAKGEFVCFIDGDDYIRKDFVLDLYSATRDNNADVAVCGFNKEIPREEVLSGREATARLLIEQENLEIVAWNKLYKKSLFDEGGIKYPEGEKHEDSLTTYKLLSSANRVVYVPKALYVYVERGGSIMDSVEVAPRLKMRERAAEEAIQFLKGREELVEAAKVSLLLAKYAFLDFSISGRVDKKEGAEALDWIRKNAKKYKNNKFLTKKLKVYNFLSTNFGGVLYTVFRKIRHE